MTNRNITVSNNRVHDLAPGVPRHRLGPAHLRHATLDDVAQRGLQPAVLRHRRSATAGAPTTPAAATHYTNRGLYNYQPRYTTATTASNNRVIGNYVHDVMQQMTDGGCIYTLSANPGATDQRQLLPADQRLVRPVLRRGLAVLHRHEQRLRRHRHLGLHANYWATTTPATSPSPTTGPPTAAPTSPTATAATSSTGTSSSPTATGRRGAQAVMAAAGVAGHGGSRQRARARCVGAQSGRCLDIAGAIPDQRHPGAAVGLQRRRQPAAGPTPRPSSCRCTAASASTSSAAAPPTAPRWIIWDCNGQTNQQWTLNANGTVTGVSPDKCLDASASAPPTAPRSSSGPATAPPTSSGPCAADSGHLTPSPGRPTRPGEGPTTQTPRPRTAGAGMGGSGRIRLVQDGLGRRWNAVSSIPVPPTPPTRGKSDA